nr:hypothetical protein [Vibrio parahaemolyticus]
MVPELKNSPKRALICLIGSLIGAILSSVFILLRFSIRSTR